MTFEDALYPIARAGGIEDAWFTLSYSPLRDDLGSIAGVLVTVVETTVRIRAEKALRASEARLRALVIATSFVAYRMNADWSEMQQLDGRGFLSDTISPNTAWLEEYIHSDDQPRVLQAIGSAIDSRSVFDLEHRVLRIDGTLGWTHSRAVPLLGDDGEIVEWFGAASDITARKDDEAQLTEINETLEQRVATALAALHQSQKLEAMGQLTGGVAHDFNNLLTPIIGGLDIFVRRGVGSDREKLLIDGALQSAERAKILVQRLLAFARRQPLQTIAVDLSGLLTGMAALIASTTGPNIAIVVDIADGLPSARIDPNQLEMAILNLCVNARDAMGQGGTLTLSAKLEAVKIANRANLTPGNYIRLGVADNGSGMDQATVAKAIEPFFSTKGVGQGTGLGLSMVHGLTSQLGGALTISSEPGVGTTIELWLPTTTDRVLPGTLSISDVRLQITGKALLVDDEDMVRTTAAEMLADLGFDVIEARDACEAVRIIESGVAIDLLVTDHIMPGMTGVELARTVQVDQPMLPILLISGFAELEGIDRNIPRLAKPFKQEELSAIIGTLLPKSLS